MAQAKYVPFVQVSTQMDARLAFIQAGTALDVAAKLATENRDQETMLNVALGWLELGRRLGYDGEGEPEPEERNHKFGFSLTSDTDKVEEEEETEEDDCS